MADGSEIAVAYFSLVPSARGIGAQIEGQIVGPAEAAGAKAGTAAGTSLASTMTKVLAGAAVFEFLKGAFDQVQAMQKVTGQTNAALTSSKDASGQSAQGIATIGNELAKVDAINHNVIQSGENVALTFTNIKAPIFKRSTADALDFAVATGRAIPAAAQLLDRALQDPVQGMARLRLAGVVLTAQQKDQIKAFEASGQMMAAQGVILDAFEAKYQGSAAAQATASDHAKVAIQGLEEAAGKDLLPVLTSVAHGLTSVAGAATHVPTSVQQTTAALLIGGVAWSKWGDKATSAVTAASRMTLTGGAPKAVINAVVADAAEADTQATLRLAAADADLVVAQERAAVAADTLAAAEARGADTFGTATAAQTAAATEATAAEAALAAAETEQAAAAAAATTTTADLAAAQATAAGTSAGLAGALASINPVLAGLAAGYVEIKKLKDQLDAPGKAAARGDETIFGKAKTDAEKLKRLQDAVAAGPGPMAPTNASDKAAKAASEHYEAVTHAAPAELKLANAILKSGDAAEIMADRSRLLKAGLTAAQIAGTFTRDTIAGLSEELSHAPTPANAAYAAWKKAEAGQVALAQSTNTLIGGVQALKAAEAEANGTGADEWAQKLSNITTYTNDTKAVTQAQQTLTEGEYSYQQAVQSTANAEYSRVQAVKAVSEAIYSEQQAEYTLTQARLTEATDLAKITTLTQSLTQARLDATRALVNDRLSAQGDKYSVTAAKYAAEEAHRAAQMGPTSSTDPNAQGELNLAAHQADLAYAQAQEKATESAQDLHHEQQLGVDKAPSVVAAAQALADGYKTVANDAHTVADDSHAVATAQDGVASAMHGVDTASQGVESAYHAQSLAAQQVKQDTNDLATAEATRVTDQQQNIVILAGLKDKGVQDSKDLRLAMVGDLQATEAELDKLGIKGQAAYQFLDSALLAAGVSQSVIDSAFGYTDPYAPTSSQLGRTPTADATANRSFGGPKTFAPAALVSPPNPLAGDGPTGRRSGNVPHTVNITTSTPDPAEAGRRVQKVMQDELRTRR